MCSAKKPSDFWTTESCPTQCSARVSVHAGFFVVVRTKSVQTLPNRGLGGICECDHLVSSQVVAERTTNTQSIA